MPHPTPTHAWRCILLRQALLIAAFLLGVWRIPYLWCVRDAPAWETGQLARQEQLANGVARWITTDLSRETYRTGSAQFDGEWLFGTYLMAGFGFGQMAILHPERRDHYLPLMERCLNLLTSDTVRAFDRESWSADPLTTLDSPQDHAAYLGYFNLLLGLHRQLRPQSSYSDLHDRISLALARRMEASPTRLLETYPGETYPVDNCAAFASVMLHARLTGTNRSALEADWRQRFRAHCLDLRTGLLIQAVDKSSGAALDAPRGSGTTLGLYFLSFSSPDLARELYQHTRTNLFRCVFGFGGVREYPAHIKETVRDIDSGPIVLGFGLSATGFLLGGSRIHNDAPAFRALYATAHAWGAPLRRDDRLNFVTGASLGDAILFAMLTALPAETP